MNLYLKRCGEKMKRNVYDFDKTIYLGDSSLDFYLFCVKKHPGVLKALPKTAIYFILYMFGVKTFTIYKEKFFGFLKYLVSVDDLLDEFWDKNSAKIAGYYPKLHKKDDVIISASPEFLLEPICSKLEISNLIASRVDKNNGLFMGINCKGKEKVRRLKEQMPEVVISEFYSDSMVDAPLANIADKAYMVKAGSIIPWSDYQPTFLERLWNTYLTKDFLLFIFCGGVGTLTKIICSLAISERINPAIAYILVYAISLFVSYALNASLIFKEKYRLDVFIKFVVSYIPNFAILFTFVFVFLNLFHWNKLLVYSLAGLLGIPVTYILVRVFAFGKKGANKWRNIS